ncbi:hypothetical protein [uncultured Maribacter sp.]|uniref:hypothetical protein n=1 Tax=uncultured Maribacter sp. TaxID=431308 RepID=UPI002628AC86|nr:hypothetical protein [uncultured Maribacter sp.]
MKSFFGFIILIISFLGANLPEIRKDYIAASDAKETAEKLCLALKSITKESEPILIAYKGAAATLKAKHSKGIKLKKDFFKEGVEYLEYSVEKAPKNIEIRCIRLSVQEHSPKILKYKKNIEEDKQFLMNNFNSTKDKAVQKFVKDYVLQSSIFDAAEKKLF